MWPVLSSGEGVDMTSSNMKITLLASLVILLGGCASGGGGLPTIGGGGTPTPSGGGGSSAPAGGGGISLKYISGQMIDRQVGFDGSKAVTSLSPVDTAGTATITTSDNSVAIGSFTAISGTATSLAYVSGTPYSHVFFQNPVSPAPLLNTVSFQNANGNGVVLLDLYAFSYQSFGYWYNKTTLTHDWFSFGQPTATTLPLIGTATYTGVAGGNYFAGGTMYRTSANMTATVNFGTASLAFQTTGTSMVPNKSTQTPTANPSLDLTGSLSVDVTGSYYNNINPNSFAGAVRSANGLSGTATGSFYGPGITQGASLPSGNGSYSSTTGSPAEVGGTYQLGTTKTSGVLIGAFGGAVQ